MSSDSAKPRLLIAEPEGFSDKALAILRSVASVRLNSVTRGELREALLDYDGLWIRLGHRVDAEVIPAHPRCRVLAVPATGLDHVDCGLCEQVGIKVLSLKGETEFLKGVRATAELAVALALTLMRRIPEAVDSVKAGTWNRDLFRGHELFGRTAGIVGMGRLGSIVAGYLRAFGMRVLGFDPRPDFPVELAERVGSITELLSGSDLVTLHVSYSPATRHLLGPSEMRSMKPGSVLVNTSRGGLVDESALLSALRDGRLAGAALDVLDGEPDIGPDHPLVVWSRIHANLLLVPHLGGNTFESLEKAEVFLAGKVATFLSGSGRGQ